MDLRFLYIYQINGFGEYEVFFRILQKTGDIQELMERVGLWEYRDVKVGEFSKGMKVRLNFVRAMLNNPRFFFWTR